MKAETRYMAAFIKKNQNLIKDNSILFNLCMRTIPSDLKSSEETALRFERFCMLRKMPIDSLDYIIHGGF